jgi:predicted ATP-binding protein involved in virulence
VNPIDFSQGNAMFIDRIDVENLRCFRKASVRFLHPDRGGNSPAFPNITLLLGDNGAGKSSLLRTVALTAQASVIQSSGYVPFSMVRREKKTEPQVFSAER